jgi:RNA polymerase sigma-70 factor (ECF subfamily)
MGKMLSEVLIHDYSRILAIAFTMVDNDADAQDLIQDLAEKILRNDVPATTYQKPLAYFSKIMRNKRRDDLRAQARTEVAPPETIDTFTTIENVETTAQYHQVREIFQKELLTLSPEMREAYMMVYFDGYSLEETAKIIGISSNTLSQRFRRFRMKFNERLKLESITMMIMATAFLNIG